MSCREECISRIDLYLDDELSEDELEIFNRHLTTCLPCQERLVERQQFFKNIRAARPAHVASPELRAKVASLMLAGPTAAGQQRPISAPSVEAQNNRTTDRVSYWARWFTTGPLPVAIACGLALCGALVLWKLSIKEARANAFVNTAENYHRQQLAGHLSLEISTSSAQEISSWFANKVPFHFRLPTYQEDSGQTPQYVLSGGRLIAFKGEGAAYIAYRIKTQLVSLLVVARSSSAASGGEETVSKGLTFHTHRRNGLQVVTWSAHDLTYALVSDLNLPSSQSCAVCHPGAKAKTLTRGLKAKNKTPEDSLRMLLWSTAQIPPLASVRQASGLLDP